VSVPSDAYKAALEIHPDSVGFSIGSKGGTLNGYDHDSVGNLLSTSPDSEAAVDVWTKYDSGLVVSGVKNANNKNDTTKFTGSAQIIVDPTMVDPNTYAGNYKSVADTVIHIQFDNKGQPTSTQIGGALGTASKPRTVFCDGVPGNPSGVQFVLNSGASGWGTLVVNGNLKLSGGSTWHGLIIVYGNGVVNFNASVGNSTVIGSVILGGYNTTQFSLGGGAQFLFSKSVLEKVKATQPVQTKLYMIVDWYE
jgi:hypothetical protein